MTNQPTWIITQRDEKWPSHTHEGQYDIIFYDNGLLGSSPMDWKTFLQYVIVLAAHFRKGKFLVNIPSDWSGKHIHIDLAYKGLKIGTEGTRQRDYVQEGVWWASRKDRQGKVAQLYDRLNARYQAKYGHRLKLRAGDFIWNWSQRPKIRYSKALMRKFRPTAAEVAKDINVLPYAFSIKELTIKPPTAEKTFNYWAKKLFPEEYGKIGISIFIIIIFALIILSDDKPPHSQV